MNRNLDGIYFRVERNQKFENVCFSDLSKEEQNTLMNGRDIEWVKSLSLHLAERLKFLGDTFGITGDD